MATNSTTPTERRAMMSLSSILSLRMLGLFMILPVFSLYAQHLIGATPFLIGMAMGIYGLTQSIFQIAFGTASDHIGRKKMILIGLSIFILGSAMCALSHTIVGMIIGRSLQGVGAVGSVAMACLADLTRESQRTKAMAIAGISIGLSFSLAMVIGPLLTIWFTVPNLFWLSALCGVIAILILILWTPTPEKISWPVDHKQEWHSAFTLLKHRSLFLLNISVFALHAIFTANFIVIPISLIIGYGFTEQRQWLIYLPVLLLAFAATLPLILIAEKKRRVKTIFLSAIVGLGIAEIIFATFTHHLLIFAFSLLLFFTSFSVLEAFLPSLISKLAPPHTKGTALGLYSCSQFLGIFFGGIAGGAVYGQFGINSVYLCCGLLALAWIIIAFRMKNP